MGLLELAQNAAKTAFTAAGNIPVACTYRSKTSATATYVATTGAVTDAYTDYPVDMIFSNFKSDEVDGQAIRSTDKKGIIPSLNLSVDPKENDQVIHGGLTYEVKRITTDPAEAAWVLLLRKP